MVVVFIMRRVLERGRIGVFRRCGVRMVWILDERGRNGGFLIEMDRMRRVRCRVGRNIE